MNFIQNKDFYKWCQLLCLEHPKEDFPSYVKSYLTHYCQFLLDLNVEESIIHKVECFSKNIYVCLIEYYWGQHESAYIAFKTAIKNVPLDSILKVLLESKFYRARNVCDRKVSPDEIFHISFEERYKVKTQRFSYPGLPCLYFGSSYQICCEEIHQTNSCLNIALFQKSMDEDIDVLDWYFFENYKLSELSEDELLAFLNLWPLVACCSFYYADAINMEFRPDYIIPQLLLELIVDKNSEYCIQNINKAILGIRYCSVKKILNTFSDNDFSYTCVNFVFPALSDQRTGKCQNLMKKFPLKEIYYLWELETKN